MPGTGGLTLKWSPTALADIERLRAFIEPHNPGAARRAAASLKQAANLFGASPVSARGLKVGKTANYSCHPGNAAMSCAIVSTAMRS